ncbi:hypothetical protein Adt_24780 [Abeliophyllum distichum]|uniref:Uncharacterized protein n=1 Tax=Abeliophyllum distichum TaxID=126358 RepID=A0ABD1SF67_9LAMI
MVHSAIHTENKISGADSWANVEPNAVDHEAGFFQQSEEKEQSQVEEDEGEKDPFAASDRINKPEEMLMEGFKKDKGSGVSDVSKALAGLEVTSLPPATATESTHIGVEGFEGNYGGIEFGTDGSTLPEDFEGINDA